MLFESRPGSKYDSLLAFLAGRPVAVIVLLVWLQSITDD